MEVSYNTRQPNQPTKEYVCFLLMGIKNRDVWMLIAWYVDWKWGLGWSLVVL